MNSIHVHGAPLPFLSSRETLMLLSETTTLAKLPCAVTTQVKFFWHGLLLILLEKQYGLNQMKLF